MLKRIFKGLLSAPIWVIRAVFIIGVLFILSGVPQLFHKTGVKSWAVDDAPGLIQTYTYVRGQGLPDKVFYFKEYASIDGIPTIAGYWENRGRKWAYVNDEKPFPPEQWGPVTIIWRTK